MAKENHLNTIEAAEVLGFHRTTVERICREGRIPAKKVHNMWLIDNSEPKRYLVDSSIKTGRIREFGQQLRTARDQLGLSQSQLAVALGVSDAAVSRWEQGNRRPRKKHCQQIILWLQQVG